MRLRPRPPLLAALALLLGACFDPAPGSTTSSSNDSGSTTHEGSTTNLGGTSLETGSSSMTLDESSSGGLDGSSSDTGSIAPGCGDGTVDDDELCDDGNDSDLDGCSSECAPLFWPGNEAPCAPQDVDFCGWFGAQCRLDAAGEDGVCYWVDAHDANSCNETPGIWTPPDSTYAMENPRTQIPEPGACITEVPNLACAPENRTVCEGAGAALCFHSLDESGTMPTGPDLCFWDTDQAGCEATSGIWTTPRDGFTDVHPNALPQGQASCITQVPNL